METQNNNDNKVVTIYDIAKEARVSVATVSRVLTNSANVRPEKKERIQKLIDKYNFTPNALARGLADTKSKIIGIIAADVRNPYYSDLFVSCEVAANKAGYTVLLCNSLGETEREEKHLEKLQEQRVEAIIQLGGRADDLESNPEYVRKVNLNKKNIPLIVTGKLDGTGCYRVQIDAIKAVDLLLEHLIGLEHRKIALIGGRGDVLSTYQKKQRYKQVLEQCGIEYREEFVAGDGGYSYGSGYEQMNQMLDQGNIPTAVIAINDFSAAGVTRSIVEHGFKIPEDISVVSYDNTYVAECMMPSLTSIDYNYQLFGDTLIKTAIALIEEREVEMQQWMSPSLVIRESSGIAKK